MSWVKRRGAYFLSLGLLITQGIMLAIADDSIDRKYRQMVSAAKQSTPIQVDALTNLIDAHYDSDAKQLIFIYRLDLSYAELSELYNGKAKEIHTTSVIDTYCGNVEMKLLRADDVGFKQVYWTSDGKKLGSFSARNYHCDGH